MSYLAENYRFKKFKGKQRVVIMISKVECMWKTTYSHNMKEVFFEYVYNKTKKTRQ